MIHSVAFKNFFSFKEESSISLVVKDKAPETEIYFLDESDTRLSKVLAIFGYNASGKTNALKTISFLQWFITDAYTENPDSKMPVIPFKFVDSNKSSDLMEISVEFSVKKNKYFYFVELTAEKILNEKLQKKELGKKKFKTLFERTWDELDEHNYTWKDNFGLGTRFKKRLRQNASVLATSIRDEHKESLEIFDFWKKVSTNVTIMGKIDDEVRNTIDAAKFFDENKKLHKKANELLQKFDLGLNNIKIKKSESENHNISFNLSGVHYGDYELAFAFESAGTRKFYALLKNILFVLENGGVAVLDEFDTDLHPMMSEALLEMFFSKEMNPHNAQLIFSAHSPHLLNLLDKYGIVLAEKNNKGESELWRLDEVKGVRLDDNYYAKYVAGAYGAIGNIEL